MLWLQQIISPNKDSTSENQKQPVENITEISVFLYENKASTIWNAQIDLEKSRYQFKIAESVDVRFKWLLAVGR